MLNDGNASSINKKEIRTVSLVSMGVGNEQLDLGKYKMKIGNG